MQVTGFDVGVQELQVTMFLHVGVRARAIFSALTLTG